MKPGGIVCAGMSSAPPPPSLVPADAVLIGQGAEGVRGRVCAPLIHRGQALRYHDDCACAPVCVQRVYEGTFCGRAVIVKERFPKSYRHPVLDEKLTKKRLVAVGAILVRTNDVVVVPVV